MKPEKSYFKSKKQKSSNQRSKFDSEDRFGPRRLNVRDQYKRKPKYRNFDTLDI